MLRPSDADRSRAQMRGARWLIRRASDPPYQPQMGRSYNTRSWPPPFCWAWVRTGWLI